MNMKKLNAALLLLALIFAACATPAAESNEKEKEKPLKEYTGEPVEHVFPDLPYAFDALEPYIDAKTMEIHYDRHHRAYYNNFINAIKGTELENASLEFIFSQMSKLSATIRNNGGGLYNHNLFWEVMAPGGQGEPSEELKNAINRTFGTMDAFKEKFNNAALTQFGSGWSWLLVKEDGSLAVSGTANQDNPLMDTEKVRGTPILGLDVWEHAYYLKYQNRRGDYVQNFWNVVNWDEVNRRYSKAKK
ncbi:Fe-Mn family superoxide dismutase [Natronoflexus pectinivorans]|uniref:Superoxide dismutase n=2 Tax=Natronoflexus pectinivorans TaxID=682526 RepID=A0A4R2GFP5_9BACT|nr:Fe-Mn family superoxide dismutase [Natronoflexus pectinivorans]